MSAGPGWYSQEDGQERYWDGQRWTDYFRVPDPDQGTGDLRTEGVDAEGQAAPVVLAPPGWHAQPDGRERFWDGEQWTDQYRLMGSAASGSATPGPPADPPWYQRKGVVILGALLLVAVTALAVSASQDDTPSGSTTASSPPARGSSSSSSSSSPSSSSSSSSSRTPDPSPTTDAYAGDYDEIFGTFEVVKKSGTGDAVITLPSGVKGAIVTARHAGSSTFTVEVLDPSNASTDLLVDTVGAYAGTTMLGAGSAGAEPASALKVRADGAWSVTVSPVASAPSWKEAMLGVGDSVYRFEMPAGDWSFINKGSGNFVVTAVGNGDGLLVNEAGDYKGVVPMTDGPAVLVIESQGAWIAKRQ